MITEILSPAGSMEGLIAAVRCGADAVYAGGKTFSARAGAKNFDDAELSDAVRYCHLHGVKIYRAMNTAVFDSEIKSVADEIKFCADIGIDGLIVQDLSVALLARTIAPELPLHASTQLTVLTPCGARLAGELGFCRVVAPRESDMENIKALCDTCETEVFVHGAQCMCLSGQCYMSAMIGSRSANRGKCAQACRLPFSRSGQLPGEEYALSLKDMSLLPHLQKLSEAGVASFKIEGRMKRPEYTAAATTAARKALSGELTDDDMELLSAVFSRSGFTDGYLLGKTGERMFGHRRYEDVTSAKDVLPKIAETYRTEIKKSVLDFHVSIRRGEPVTVTAADRDGITVTVTGELPRTAINRSITAEDVQKHLSKLGNTIYEFGSLTADIGDGLFVTGAELNEIRRSIAEQVDIQRIDHFTPHYREISPENIAKLPEARKRELTEFRYRAFTEEDVRQADGFDMIIAPMQLLVKIISSCTAEKVKKLSAALPEFTFDEKRLNSDLEKVYDSGVRHFHADNFNSLGALTAFRQSHDDIVIHTGQGLNITNSYAVSQLEGLGVADVLLSMELRHTQAAKIRSDIPVGLRVYGRFPVMTVKNSPITSDRIMEIDFLTDRTGRKFHIRTFDGYAQILNCDITDVIAKMDVFNVSFVEVSDGYPKTLLDKLEKRESFTGKGYTNGLYQRGVI
ncbi:MAG: U32 family peptidase [Oscillospiraceae bacterium]|nr:U32 family peptidase [Oscillospiraceae bacterium]